MDCIVHGAAKSQTRMTDFHFHVLSYRSPATHNMYYLFLIGGGGGSASKESACNV